MERGGSIGKACDGGDMREVTEWRGIRDGHRLVVLAKILRDKGERSCLIHVCGQFTISPFFFSFFHFD
jgi:hypothetical protein